MRLRKLYGTGYLLVFAVVLALFFENVYAENGYEFWLRYKRITDEKVLNDYKDLCKEIVVVTDNHLVLNSAEKELVRGISEMLGVRLAVTGELKVPGSLIIGTYGSKLVRDLLPLDTLKPKTPDGYRIVSLVVNEKPLTIITGRTDRAVLYGVFNFLRLMQTDKPISRLNLSDDPENLLRMVDHWDNPSGSIERGYAGKSIFHWNKLPELETRYYDYARMLASIGINGCVLNNVNTAKNNLTGWKLITREYLVKLKALADVFRAYGIKVFLSVNFSSPVLIDDLKTADPLEESVKQWWKEKVAEIYSLIPDFGGFLIKADSEGEPGPFSYGRTPAEGANMIAGTLKPYGGLLIWRAFVYKHNGSDRATQAYKIFKPFDGKFAQNVVIQIKNGPIDFQVREPVSPLFGAMPHTNQMLELQITQEYTGQSTHLCYLVPEWKEILSFDTHSDGKGSTVSKIISGEMTGQRYSGISGVSNIGSDSNWTGLLLAQSNTYGYGRLAWDPDLSSKEITYEWVKMTFGEDPEVVKTISEILLSSWKTYENYTSPLGVGIMCNGSGKYSHFLPAPEKRVASSKADEEGVGYDRTYSTGSGFVNQYFPPVREMYENIKTCPEELLLFFHHIPYTYRLSSGETVIQHIYDTHFEGVEQVKQMKEEWETLKGKIDKERFQEVLAKFDDQIKQACIWRDAINNFFYKLSNIPDGKGRLQEASGESENLYTK